MVAIGTVLEGLPLQQDSKTTDEKQTTRITYTLSEAQAAGLTIQRDAPEPCKCEFCGNLLNHDGVRMGNVIVFWSPSPRRCTCDKAAVYWAERDEQAEIKRLEKQNADEQQAKQDRINRLLGKSGIKKRFMERTFDGFQVDDKNKKAYAIAKDYADRFPVYAAGGNGLYFEGTYGTGKTHLAAAIALQLIGQGIPCICKTSIDLFADIKRTFSAEYGPAEHEVIGIYKDVDLLIIDDLGKEMATEWSTATLYDIMNERYEAMKPTIVTTNYNAAALVNRLTPKHHDNTNMAAMMSRLKGSSKLISMAWDDWRQRGL